MLTPLADLRAAGDFEKSGRIDEVFSGLYGDLTEKRPTVYFLFVGRKDPPSNRLEKLYYEEFKSPVFLFPPGTTGKGDPGTQSFSLSTCVGCNSGFDYFWDAGKKKFRKSPWKRMFHQEKKMVLDPGEIVDPGIVDEALKITGSLPDVIDFVKMCKEKKVAFATRVQSAHERGSHPWYDVMIIEKNKNKEILYDSIRVDVELKKVVYRQKKADLGTKK
jgi:hypothetical protein